MTVTTLTLSSHDCFPTLSMSLEFPEWQKRQKIQDPPNDMSIGL